MRLSHASNNVMPNSPNRLTLRQAAQLQKMADVKGLYNYDVTQRYDVVDSIYNGATKNGHSSVLNKYQSLQHVAQGFSASRESNEGRQS